MNRVIVAILLSLCVLTGWAGGGLYLLRIDGDGRNETVNFVVR